MKRRDFLTSLGLGGYTLIVRADDVLAEDQLAKASPDEIRAAFDIVAPPENRRAADGEPHMTQVNLDCDVFVAGGGMAGVCAAISAARNGAKVVLVQDRSRLGGNASSEVKMHIVGADHHGGRSGWREGGLIEEFRLDDAANNPQRCWELWDLLLYDKVMSEPNIRLLLDSVLFSAEMKDNQIQRVLVRCDKTEHLYRIKAKVYCDCTGDSRLGLEAGAEMRHGRESRAETGETLAIKEADDETLGSSILFTSRDFGRPMPFTAPKWARKVKKEMLRYRPVNTWEYGYWWIEWGGKFNTIHDNERIRFELLSIVMGVWDYIKNSGNHPTSANWAMDWVGMIPGKRESRRLIGDHLLHQNDLTGFSEDFEDAVAIGGWPLDDHPPAGFDDYEKPPFVSIKVPEVYNIPLRSLYSKNISNLMMAGRNISATHVAFTSTRVMATCAVIGQAVGTAAAFCAAGDYLPRDLYKNKEQLARYQQRLLRDDQTIKNRKNVDPDDLARKAKVTASAALAEAPAEHVINGLVRDMPGKHENRWATEMTSDGAWIELSWDKPQTIRHVQITFDSGFHRELTLSSSDQATKRMIRAPQPETVRDYTLSYRASQDDSPTEIAKVTGNHQRLKRHDFAPIEAQSIRIHVQATNGNELARIFEVRCYG